MVPDLLGTDAAGEEIRLSKYRGYKVALYFYPRDGTPGCTDQACNLRDFYPELESAGYKVIGVSPDSARTHVKFIRKHKLPFTLIADENHTLAQAFGVWQEKNPDGKGREGIKRTTFLLNEEGKVERIIDKKEIRVKSHAFQIIHPEP